LANRPSDPEILRYLRPGGSGSPQLSDSICFHLCPRSTGPSLQGIRRLGRLPRIDGILYVLSLI